MIKSIIVGIDPGTTTGIAILDINKKILHLESKKHMRKNEIIKIISKFGNPIIIATDVYPCPKTVEKVSHAFGSKLFCPPESLSTIEKLRLTKKYENLIEDTHQKDSLASAIKAYKAHSHIFKKVDSALSRLNMVEFFNDVIRKVIKSETDNISETIGDIIKEIEYGKASTKKNKVMKRKRERIPKKYKKIIDEFRQKLVDKDREIKSLKSLVKTLRNDLIKAKSGTSDFALMRCKMNVKTLSKEIRDLRKTINFINKLREIERSNSIPVIEIKKLTYDELHEIDEKINLRGSVVMSDDVENFVILNTYNIKALITTIDIPEFQLQKLNFSVINRNNVDMKRMGEINVIDRKKFDESLAEARRKGFLKWLKTYKRRKK